MASITIEAPKVVVVPSTPVNYAIPGWAIWAVIDLRDQVDAYRFDGGRGPSSDVWLNRPFEGMAPIRKVLIPKGAKLVQHARANAVDFLPDLVDDEYRVNEGNAPRALLASLGLDGAGMVLALKDQSSVAGATAGLKGFPVRGWRKILVFVRKANGGAPAAVADDSPGDWQFRQIFGVGGQIASTVQPIEGKSNGDDGFGGAGSQLYDGGVFTIPDANNLGANNRCAVLELDGTPATMALAPIGIDLYMAVYGVAR
jgi:hypothetical protein